MNLGWYTGTRDLLKVTMKGEFEGFYGKASESWEHQYEIVVKIPPKQSNDHDFIFQAKSKRYQSLDNLALSVLNWIKTRPNG